jgi:hypothetical protein
MSGSLHSSNRATQWVAPRPQRVHRLGGVEARGHGDDGDVEAALTDLLHERGQRRVRHRGMDDDGFPVLAVEGGDELALGLDVDGGQVVARLPELAEE